MQDIDQQRYLAKILLASTDEQVNADALLKLIFEEDPTDRDFQSPVWADVLQLLYQYHQNTPSMDYAISVDEAAKLKGCTPDAIRKAINRGDLDAKKIKNRWTIDTASLEQWTPTNRGQNKRAGDKTSNHAQLRFGNEPGRRMSVYVDGVQPQGQSVDASQGNLYEATVSDWCEMVVYQTSKNSRRLSTLTRSSTPNELTHGSMYIRGQFDIQHENNKRRADAAWKAYKDNLQK